MSLLSRLGWSGSLLASSLLVGCGASESRSVVVDAPQAAPVARAASSTPGEFTETPSGLKYKILNETKGRKPKASDTVVAHYRGWLDDGTEFDSSYRRGEPTSFPLNGVIPGWTEGLQLIGKGGKIELEIPSNLGYGPNGMPGAIPPNATLHFEVELVDIQ